MTNDIESEGYRPATPRDLENPETRLTIFHPAGARHTDHAGMFHPELSWWRQSGWSRPYVRMR